MVSMLFWGKAVVRLMAHTPLGDLRVGRGRVLKANLFIAGDKDGARLPHGPSASGSQHSLNLIRIQRTADSLGTKCWKSLMSNPSRSPFPVRTRQMAPPHYASQQNNH